MIRWRVGRPAPYGDTSTFAALADVVRSEAGILNSDAPEAAEERVHAVLGRVIEDPDERGRLAPHLIALVAGEVSEGDTSRDEAFAAWGRFLDRLGAENPTVIVFEDMHAASEPSLAFVESLLDAERASALLIVVAARPELFDLRPGWGDRRSRWVTIVVEPLDAELTGTLVRSLPLDRPLDPGLARIVVERAGGNPLVRRGVRADAERTGRRGRPERGDRGAAHDPRTAGLPTGRHAGGAEGRRSRRRRGRHGRVAGGARRGDRPHGGRGHARPGDPGRPPGGPPCHRERGGRPGRVRLPPRPRARGGLRLHPQGRARSQAPGGGVVAGSDAGPSSRRPGRAARDPLRRGAHPGDRGRRPRARLAGGRPRGRAAAVGRHPHRAARRAQRPVAVPACPEPDGRPIIRTGPAPCAEPACRRSRWARSPTPKPT